MVTIFTVPNTDVTSTSLLSHLQHWCHSHQCHGISNHWNCLFNSLFRLTANVKKAPNYWPFVRGIHRWPVDSPYRGPVIWKAFPCHDGFVWWWCLRILSCLSMSSLCWVTHSPLLCACRPLLSLRVDHPNLPIETQVTHTMVKVKVIPKVTCNLAPSVPLRWLSHVLIDHIFFGYSSRRYLYVVEYFIFLTLDNPFVLFTASLSTFYRLLCYILGLCLLDNVTFSGLHLFVIYTY